MVSVQAEPLRTNAPLKEPPIEKGNFFVGSLVDFGSAPLEFFPRLFKTHGDLVKFRVGPLYAHIVRHPKDVARVLQENHTAYGKQTLGYKKMKLLLGEGLVTSDGDFWLRQRRIAQPAFHRERIAGFADTMVGRTQEMLERVSAQAERGEDVEMYREFCETAMEIAGDTLLSVDMSGEATAVAKALEFVLPYVDNLTTTILPFAEKFPTRKNREFKRQCKVLDDVVNGVIEDRRRMAERGDDLPNDLLTMLLEARDEDGSGMSDEQLRDEVMTMFLAGHETTANTLSWTVMLLAQNPEWQQKLHEELASVLEDGRDPTLEDLRRLPLLDRVVKEGLRLYPAAWMVARNARVDSDLSGYAIKKDTVVFLSPYFTHRHPEVWDDPEAFDPDRFLPENEAKLPKGAYIPFVAGPRQCIGKAFAEMELRLVLAMLVRDFRIELADSFVFEPEPTITMRPGKGVPVRLSPWNDDNAAKNAA